MAALIGIGHLGCSLASPSSFSAIVVDVYRLVQYNISGAPSRSRVANFNHHASYLNFILSLDLSRTVFIIPLSSSDKHSARLPPSTYFASSSFSPIASLQTKVHPPQGPNPLLRTLTLLSF
ncbi:hypothetical protein C1H46_017791 [Malus baccata]|uniref:Uncharacterized protein n=1 Tax=Malus baccata TaxID=106549 RepID=A0A540MD02_MALBA|nr:hypothetical protein C1H46_017791 [Malus baccata]